MTDPGARAAETPVRTHGTAQAAAAGRPRDALANATRRLTTALAWLLFVAAFGLAAWRGVAGPMQNWDMIAYVGSAVSWGERDPQRIYDDTLADLQASVGSGKTRALTSSMLADNPEALRQQFPFYTIKPGYIALVKLLHTFGSSYAAATWRIAAFGMLALGLVLGAWRPALDARIWLPGVVVFGSIGTPPMWEIAQYSTPDSVAIAATLAAFLALVKWRSLAGFIVLGVVAMLLRPDGVVLLGIGCVAVACAREPATATRPALRPAGAAAALCVLGIVHIVVQRATGSYGWAKLFYYSFVDKLARPAETTVHVTPSMYFDALKDNLAQIGNDPCLLPMLAASALALVLCRRQPPQRRVWRWLLGAAWTALAVRFVLYPAAGVPRYYYTYYLLVFIAAAEMAGPWLNGRIRRLDEYLESLTRRVGQPGAGA
jgi:hypothetical protein